MKVNTLLLDGIEDELPAFIELTREREVHVRFIEFMPLDRRLGGRGRLVPAPQVLQRLRELYELVPHEGPLGHGPAQYWHVPGARGTIGFIAGVSEHFCESCNRLRLTADGRLRTCLFSGEETAVRSLIASPDELRAAILGAVSGKSFDRCVEQRANERAMSRDRRLSVSSEHRRADERGAEEAPLGELSHIDEQGRARMVDVGAKDETERVARAEALVVMAPETLRLIADQAVAKGDVLATARLAGIMAAKRTHELIPLCHQLNLTAVHVDITADEELPGLRVVTEARLRGRTGRGDGGARGRLGREPHHLRHVQGRGPRHGGARRPSAGEERRPQRPLATSRPERGDVMSVHTVDGSVVSVNVAEKKGVRKDPVESITLVVEHGVEGDAHAGPWHRQVSLLARESVDKMLAACPTVDNGSFGENITTEGLVLYELPVGARFYCGECLLEVTQIGKECHDRCAIFHQAGDCVMPREGIFARVLEGGQIAPGDGHRAAQEQPHRGGRAHGQRQGLARRARGHQRRRPRRGTRRGSAWHPWSAPSCPTSRTRSRPRCGTGPTRRPSTSSSPRAARG